MATTVEELAKEAQALRRKASSLKRQLRDVRVGEQQKKTDPPQEKTECFVCGEGNNMKECPLIKSLIQGNGVGPPTRARISEAIAPIFKIDFIVRIRCFKL